MAPTAPPPEQPVAKVQGSAIQAAETALAKNTEIQVEAVKTLGSKMSGGRYRRRRFRGGAEIEVKNLNPMAVSAGTSGAGAQPKNVQAGMMELAHKAAEGSKYDALGSAPPKQVTVGGRRKRTRRKGNARHPNLHSRKRGGSHKRTRRVRHSRRKLRSVR
jgi:hypothetical protein